MGNRYTIMCGDCKEYFDLGSENVWWQNKERMYLLKDFLLSHTGHSLVVGGDEWNCAYTCDNKQLPTNDYKKFDGKYSEEDYEEEMKLGDSQKVDNSKEVKNGR